MLFSVIPQVNDRQTAELIAVPFWQGQKSAKPAATAASLNSHAALPIQSGDFTGEKGETVVVYLKSGKEARCLCLGLGKENELSVDSLRIAYAACAKLCQKKGISKINLVLPNINELRTITVNECIQGICEGILLVNYKWEELETIDEETTLLKSVTLIGILPKILPLIREFEEIATSIYLARDLINANADSITPFFLGKTALLVQKRFPSVKTTVLDKKQIEKEKMGLLLAVGRGATNEPHFITMSYKGDEKSKDHTVIVGKGITFDTGGLNLKPSGSMEDMRADMSGAASVMGTIAAVAALNMKVNVTAVIPTAENAIDALSYKPGDVYVSHSGKTVEIGNTDAEGRLILADALSYAILHLAPTRIIDLATLTGSIIIALGESISGLFCNDEKLASDLLEASHTSAEQLWRMPLYSPYRELLKSDVADIKNVGGKPGGAILAALFLQDFVGKLPWAHLDIAGTAFGTKESNYLPKNGTGFGIRLMIEFFRKLSK